MYENNLVKEITPEEVKFLNPNEITYIAMKNGSIIMVVEKEAEKVAQDNFYSPRFSTKGKKYITQINTKMESQKNQEENEYNNKIGYEYRTYIPSINFRDTFTNNDLIKEKYQRYNFKHKRSKTFYNCNNYDNHYYYEIYQKPKIIQQSQIRSKTPILVMRKKKGKKKFEDNFCYKINTYTFNKCCRDNHIYCERREVSASKKDKTNYMKLRDSKGNTIHVFRSK